MRIVDAVALFSFIIDGGSFFFYIFAPELYNIIINMKNKIRLLMTLLLLAVMGSAWAEEEVTFHFSEYYGKGTQAYGSEYTMVKDDVSITGSKFYCSPTANGYAQFYADGRITITPAEGVVITKIVFSVTGSSYNGGTITISPSTGTVAINNNNVTWTGSASSAFTLSNTKQMRWTQITVTYTHAEKHTATFSVNGITTTQDFAENASITFPDEPNDILGKTFVGWIETTIDGTTNEVPSFVTSATMGSTDVTYYAVFATAHESDEPVETKAQTLQYDTWSYSGTTTDRNTYRLFGNGSYIESAPFDLSKLSKVIVYGGTFGGSSNNSLTIGDGTNIWKSVTVSGNSNTGINTYTDGEALTGTNKLRITATAGNGSTTGLRISKVEIFISEPSFVYSDYCTTVVAAAVATPTFTPVGGTYDEVQNVTISCETDGATIYYTINGDEPTKDSTPYNTGDAIVVTLGTTTIKAIAYLGEDVSEMAEATYEIVKKSAGLSYPQNSYSINLYDGFVSPELSNLNNLSPIIYSSSDESVAQINADGAVSLFGEGTTTITASFAGNDEYEEGTATYTLTVSKLSVSTIYTKVTSTSDLVAGKKYIIVCEEHEVGMGGHGRNSDGSLANWRVGVPNLVIQGNTVDISGTGVVELILGGDAQNGYTFKATDENNYLGYSGFSNELKFIEEDALNEAALWSVGTSNNGEVYVLLSNNVSGRELMYNYNQPRFACYKGTQEVAVLYVQEPGVEYEEVVFAKAGYKSYVTENAIDWAATRTRNNDNVDVHGYKVTEFSSTSVVLVELSDITTVANTPVILKGKKGVNLLVIASDEGSPIDNLLKRGYERNVSEKDYMYVLQKSTNWDEADPYKNYKFYRLNPTRWDQIGDRQAYLVLPESERDGQASTATMVIIHATDEEPLSEDAGVLDGINSIERNDVLNGEFYTISGQRVTAPKKGLYIVNGKKVLVK